MALLSGDGLEIEILEVLMQVYQTSSSSADAFGNMKLPMIAVAILLVLGYQYMKQKGKMGGGGGGKKDLCKFDQGALKSGRGKSLGGALGGLAGLRKKGRIGRR